MELCRKKPWLWLVLLGAIVLGQVLFSSGCFQEEKGALLDFKATYANDLLLPSWVDNPKSNCCAWERVTCNSSSGHVIHLALGNLYTAAQMVPDAYPYGQMGPYMQLIRKPPYCLNSTRTLNWSMFLSFRELRSLNLSSYCFRGFTRKEDDRKSTLKKLETLDLSFNYLNESIMKLVVALPSIKNLTLAGNFIAGGPLVMKELSLLPNLKVLDLSMNRLGLGSLFATQDYKSKPTLKKLETLDLSFNYLNESIMELMGALPSIKFLTLADNFIGGPFPMRELLLLPNLEVLDLSANRLVSPVTTQVISDTHSSAEFYVLKKLKALNLADNNFDKGILKSLVAFPTLRNLNLGYNPIKGDLDDKVLANLSKLEVLDLSNSAINASFPNQGLCKMKQLQALDLSYNNFRGTLDRCLGNLTSLRSLNLCFNFLSGNPAPLIAHLASIEELCISFNEFEGIFPLNIFGNHSKLKRLAIGNMEVETENPPWVASFQLEQLAISSCELNLATKVIPTFLSNQNGMRSIDLSGNNLVGKFPSWLLVNNPNLEEVYLFDNSFTGPFELPFDLHHHMDQMHTLSLANNQIQGKLPNNIGSFFPHLQILDVSKNMFDGPIPASIGEMSSLEGLFLGNNRFSGNVPEHILNGCFSLETLMMDNNQLNGTLLSVIRKLRLFTLTASRNNFEGAITDEWCQLKFFMLDLSHNKFSGTLPSCFKAPNYLFLQGNSLTGMIPEALISNYSQPISIDLSDNKLTGTIPDSVYKLWSLRFLLVAGNKLQGQISSQICQLKNINILDLSRNNLTGSIPSCFSNMSFGNVNKTFYSLDRIIPFSPRPDVAEMQLTIKNLYLSYKSDKFQMMSGLDLSCNQLKGEIPQQIGDLHYLHSLNLSHNHLNGLIPESFQKLENIESLDLSNNNLSGQIPLHLEDLHYLAIFNVSFNNLSGRAPNQGQFANFDEKNYKGNPYLTWNNSNRGSLPPPPPPPPPPTLLHDGEEKDPAIDLTVFYWTFASSYVTVLIVLVTILWINPHWRRTWFYFVQVCLHKCFGQFLEDAFY